MRADLRPGFEMREALLTVLEFGANAVRLTDVTAVMG